MARRRRRRRSGLGAVNADAFNAIAAARKGNCKSALKSLYDANPAVQGSTSDKTIQDFKIASMIVAQHCTVDRGPRGQRGKRYGSNRRRSPSPGFDGARRRRRKKRR